MTTYLADIFGWWEGKRPSRGVEIEDADKCLQCDFEKGCAQRVTKDLEIDQPCR